MYCTLQEAYNIPSFTNKKKKGCMNPLSTKLDNQQSPPIAKISADNYDAYDPYTAESGKERALAMNLAQNAGVNMQQQQQQVNVNNGYANGNGKMIEGFDGQSMPSSFDQVNDVSYNGQMGDYKYYCDAFGICPKPPLGSSTGSQSIVSTLPQNALTAMQTFANNQMQTLPVVEGFQNSPSTQQIDVPYYGSNPMGKSGPLQAPPYVLPVNDSNMQQFQQALTVAVDDGNNQGSTQCGTYPIRRVEMNKVGGYYDEELEDFLTTQSMKNEKLPEPLKKTPNDVDLSPLTPLNATESSTVTQPLAISQNTLQSPPTVSNKTSSSYINYLQSPQYILDLLLFIGGGILIILLCDQIFKLGMSYGMRDTVKVLMPYLKDIKITGD
jgi:hypothetical protein